MRREVTITTIVNDEAWKKFLFALKEDKKELGEVLSEFAFDYINNRGKKDMMGTRFGCKVKPKKQINVMNKKQVSKQELEDYMLEGIDDEGI